MYKRFFKRFLDIVLSFLGIVVLAVPMLIIALIVVLDSKGPAIFKTKRVGKDKKEFVFLKFRSMRTDAPEDCAPRLLDADAYVTKVGAFLRKTSLDELPQLFCILKGDMSIIGPRPAGISEQDLVGARDKYGANDVLPGLTGLAQVSGRDVLASDPEKKAKKDGEYVANITFWGDVKIFFQTIAKVFSHEDVVEGTKVMEESSAQAENEKPEAQEESSQQTRAREGLDAAEEKREADETAG